MEIIYSASSVASALWETCSFLLFALAITILRLPSVIAKTGMARSTIYKQIDLGLLVRPIPLGGKSIGFPEHEVDAVLAARIAGRTDVEIKLLVVQLTGARKDAAGSEAA